MGKKSQISDELMLQFGKSDSALLGYLHVGCLRIIKHTCTVHTLLLSSKFKKSSVKDKDCVVLVKLVTGLK